MPQPLLCTPRISPWPVDLEVRRTFSSLGSDFLGSLAGIPILPSPTLKIEQTMGEGVRVVQSSLDFTVLAEGQKMF